MAYANDVGGMHGFGDIRRPDGPEPPFASVWETQVAVLNYTFLGAGAYTLDEFRHTIEQIPPGQYYEMPYYERWLTALEALVGDHGDR